MTFKAIIPFALVVLLCSSCGPGHHMLGEQFATSVDGPILSVQGYLSGDAATLEQAWPGIASEMSTQPGFVSATLSPGVGDSPLWLVQSEWNSHADLQAAFSVPEVLAAEEKMPDAAFEHLFRSGAKGTMDATNTTVEQPYTVLINPFTVDEADVDEFVDAWQAAADWLREQPGFVDTRLHKSLQPDSRFRFVNVATWESAEAFLSAASQPEFLEISARIPDGVEGGPALYRVERR